MRKLVFGALLAGAFALAICNAMPIVQSGSRYFTSSSSSSSSSGGSLTDGGTAFVSGSGFGTNSATVYSLKPVIEANSAGTNLESMTGIPGTWGFPGSVHIKVNTSAKLYGTKGLGSIGSGSSGVFGASLDTGGAITNFFYRDYVRINKEAGNPVNGQWKWVRWNGNGGVDDKDPDTYYIGDWFGINFDFAQSTANCEPPTGCGGTGQQHSTNWGTAFATWYEREIYFVPSSTTGGTDGRIEVRMRRVSDAVEIENDTWTDLNIYKQATRERYFIIYNYQGNNDFNDGAGNNTSVYQDGVYISNGSQARIYLSQTCTWSAVSATNGALKEIQDFTSWSDTRIDFNVRQGALSSLSGACAFVVLPNGSVNSTGYSVTPTSSIDVREFMWRARAANDNEFEDRRIAA